MEYNTYFSKGKFLRLHRVTNALLTKKKNTHLVEKRKQGRTKTNQLKCVCAGLDDVWIVFCI